MIKQVTKNINMETGEVFEKSKRFSYFDDKKGYLFASKRQYSRSFSTFPLPASLNNSERGQVLLLTYQMQKDSNLLVYRTSHGYRPLTVEKMGEIIGLKKRQTISFLGKMKTLGVIAKVSVEVGERKEVHYYINPLYFHSGKWIGWNLYFIFREELKPFIPQYIQEKFEEGERPKLERVK